MLRKRPASKKPDLREHRASLGDRLYQGQPASRVNEAIWFLSIPGVELPVERNPLHEEDDRNSLFNDGHRRFIAEYFGDKYYYEHPVEWEEIPRVESDIGPEPRCGICAVGWRRKNWLEQLYQKPYEKVLMPHERYNAFCNEHLFTSPVATNHLPIKRGNQVVPKPAYEHCQVAMPYCCRRGMQGPDERPMFQYVRPKEESWGHHWHRYVGRHGADGDKREWTKVHDQRTWDSYFPPKKLLYWDKQAQALGMHRKSPGDNLYISRQTEFEQLCAISPRTREGFGISSAYTSAETVEDYFRQLSPILESLSPTYHTESQARAAARAARQTDDDGTAYSSVSSIDRYHAFSSDGEITD